MKSSNPQKLEQILRSGRLADLVDRANRRKETTHRIKSMLPDDEADHLVAASVDGSGTLTIVMDSSAWAAKVRYRQEQLGAVSLRVKVAPSA